MPMTPFEYLSVLVSIVLALGITHLLSGLSSILRSEGKVRLCPIQLSWSLLVLVLQLSVWWRYWDFRDQASWGLFQFMSLLVLPALSYLVARIIMPDVIRDNTYDMRAHFDQVHQEFFWVFFGAILFSILFRPLLFGHPLWAWENLPGAVIALLTPSGALVSDRRWHGALVFLIAAIWLGAGVFLWGDLMQSM